MRTKLSGRGVCHLIILDEGVDPACDQGLNFLNVGRGAGADLIETPGGAPGHQGGVAEQQHELLELERETVAIQPGTVFTVPRWM